MKRKKMAVATIEARMSATRLPGKMALELYPGLPALGAVIERLKACEKIDGIVVATTDKSADEPLAAMAKKYGADCFRGSESDVLGRVVGAGASAGADIVALVTGDCSCISPLLIDEGIEFFINKSYDLVSNCLEDTYPVGIDMQVASFQALLKAHDLASHEPYCDDARNFEHTNYFIKAHPDIFNIYRYPAPEKYRRTDIQLTLDTEADLAVLRKIYSRLYRRDRIFDIDDIIKLIDSKPGILDPLKVMKINRLGY